MAHVGIDLGIFEALEESKEPVTLDTLAQKNGASTELLGKSNIAP